MDEIKISSFSVIPVSEPESTSGSRVKPGMTDAEKEGGEEGLQIEDQAPSKAGIFFDKAIRYGLYVLAFLLPLFFLPVTANVLELNKMFLLFIFAAVLIVFWLAKVLALRQLQMQRSLLNILVVLVVLATLASGLLASNRFQALVGLGGIIAESFVTVVSLAIIYFLASNSLKNREQTNMFLSAILASSVIAGILAVFQFSGNPIFPWDAAKTAGFNTIGSANALGIFLAAALVLAVALFVDSKRPLWQMIFLGACAAFLLFVIIALNFSNIWWGLVGVMMLVVGIGIIKQGRASQTRLILAMVVLAMALLLNLTKINISSGWLNVPAEVGPSAKATLEIDKGALSDNLFFGAGPGSFAYSWELYRSTLVNQTMFWNVKFSQGSSKMLSLPTSLGLIGSVFWILLSVFFAAWGVVRLVSRKGDGWPMAFAFFSSWLFLALMQFLYPTNLTLEFMYWLTMGVSLFLLKSLAEKEPAAETVSLSFRRESPLASVFSFVLVIFLVIAISFFYLGFNFWRADALFQNGVKASINEGNLEKGYSDIAKAISLNNNRDTYLASLSQVALLMVNQELAKPKSTERDLRAQQLIADSVNLSKAATDINPQNPDNWIQRGTIYRAVIGYFGGAEEWMINSFIEATRLQPNNPVAYFELGRSYVLLSDFTMSQAGQDQEKQAKALDYLNKAEEQFTKAVDLKGDYSPAHYQLALIYDRQGKIDSSIEKMEITKANFPQDIGVAFQLGLLYYKKDDLGRAKGEFERAVGLDTNYSNARYFLGLIYDRQGDKAAAKDQFIKISELNPDNEEVKRIIQNLDIGFAALDGIAQAPEDRLEPPIEEPQPETR